MGMSNYSGAGIVSGVGQDMGAAKRLQSTDRAKQASGSNGLISENLAGNAEERRSNRLWNVGRLAHNFYSPLGGRSQDAYEAAQQDRNFHQTEGYKKWGNELDPATQLKEAAGTEAYNFRKGLPEAQIQAQNDIKMQSGEALGEGLKNTRQGANSRGLLYSGLRQGAEQGLRGRVANAMSSNIAQSNRGLANEADAKDRAVASMGLASAQQAQEASNRASELNTQNSVFRAQQMQQLAGSVGYGFGLASGGGQEKQPTGLVGSQSNYDKYGGGSYGGGR